MSTVQFFALLLCAFCLAALLLGLIRPHWVLPLRRATRWQVLLLYSAACALVLVLAGALPDRSAHAQIADTPAGRLAEAGAAGAGGEAVLGPGVRGEQEPAPESLRALASRVLLDLGLGSGHRLRIGRLTVVYEDPVTPEQAAALGDFLSRSELGAGSGPGSGSDRPVQSAGHSATHDYGPVQLHLSRSATDAGTGTAQPAYELRIATPFSHRQQIDAETKAAYQLVGLIVSGLAFDGAPVVVHLCTSLLRPLLILRPQLG